MNSISYPYTEFDNIDKIESEFALIDHICGFDINYKNIYFDKLQQHSKNANSAYIIKYHQILSDNIKNNYSNLKLLFDAESHHRINLKHFVNYKIHPQINYKNFICSFNGTPHTSRKLLVSILEKFGYFNIGYCSKNFTFTTDTLNGHITDYVNDRFYSKFFISNDSETFFNSINSFGHVQYDHKQNIYNLESKLTESFLHIVSETMATSYVPFVTEKFLYSIVTRGLFLAYAQPGWHNHLEKYYGFKKYNKLFDYRFDAIQNPIERLVELMTMVSKFSRLTIADWNDLYLIEQDTIEYNYNHYFSGKYLEYLRQHNN
jgi:hypothetical protein